MHHRYFLTRKRNVFDVCILRGSDLHRRPPAYEAGNLTTDIPRIHEASQHLYNSGSGIATPQPIGFDLELPVSLQ